MTDGNFVYRYDSDPRCVICLLVREWRNATFTFHSPKCETREGLIVTAERPFARWCCESAVRVVSESRPPTKYKTRRGWSSADFRERFNRSGTDAYIPTPKQQAHAMLTLLAYTLRAWKWTTPQIGEQLPGVRGSAQKKAASRAIRECQERLGLPTPLTAEFDQKLCAAHRYRPPRGRYRLPYQDKIKELSEHDAIGPSGKNYLGLDPAELTRSKGFLKRELRAIEVAAALIKASGKKKNS